MGGGGSSDGLIRREREKERERERERERKEVTDMQNESRATSHRGLVGDQVDKSLTTF